jgi:hypothetical protein
VSCGFLNRRGELACAATERACALQLFYLVRAIAFMYTLSKASNDKMPFHHGTSESAPSEDRLFHQKR